MKLTGVKLIIRAYDANGYQRDILIESERQVHQHDDRITRSFHPPFGMVIEPAKLPEMVRFQVILECEEES